MLPKESITPCDEVFLEHHRATGDLFEIDTGIDVLNRLREVADQRRTRSLEVWQSEKESSCTSYSSPLHGESLIEITELRNQLRLLIGFLQLQEQELIVEAERIE